MPSSFLYFFLFLIFLPVGRTGHSLGNFFLFGKTLARPKATTPLAMLTPVLYGSAALSRP
jgi:hypothetical protein